MAHDVFISYPSKNKPIADAICAKLELHNIRCWFAPRDILPGQEYAHALVNAIDSSKIFILVFSAETNNSPHIMSEVREAFNHNLIIIPFRIDDIQPSQALEFYIGGPHWLDALTPPVEKHIDELVNVVQLNLSLKAGDPILSSKNLSNEKLKPRKPHSEYIVMVGLLFIVCLGLVLNYTVFSPNPGIQASPTPVSTLLIPAPITSTPAPITSTPAPITSTPAPITSTPAPITSSPSCVVGTWKINPAKPSDIQTWNFYSDGSFKDIHYFSNGGSQVYDSGTWYYAGNNRYTMQLTSTTHTVECNGDSFTLLADSTGPSRQFYRD